MAKTYEKMTLGSLLMGSVGLFAILALVMFLTRKIDWYAVNPSSDRTSPAAERD